MRFARILLRLWVPAFLAAAGGLGAAPFERPGWAVRGDFPAEPKRDEFRAPSPFGEVVSERYFVEQAGEAFVLLRTVHPIAFTADAADQLYDHAKREILAARSGQVAADQPMSFGDYLGRRVVIEHRRAQRTKELRLVLVGSTLYACTHERPAKTELSAAGKAFLDAMAVQPAFANARAIEETERWREVGDGRFKVRYDATRWYRDPTDAEPGIYNLLRLDKQAEAQLIAEPELTHDAGLLDSVLKIAREGSDDLRVRKRGQKRRGDVSMEEVEFVVRQDGKAYVNRGYYYSGAEGSVQFRAWAVESEYRGVEGDIAELLDGLTVVR